MVESIEKTQNWIRRVQRGSDKTKRIWLVVLSGCCMLFVIFFWLVYISFTIPKLSGASQKADEKGVPFWQVLGEGIRVVGGNTWKKVINVKEGILHFGKTTEKMINNFSNDFTIESGGQHE